MAYSDGTPLKLGDWLIHCDSCQKKIYYSQALKRWDGFLVCRADWEEDNPQDRPYILKPESGSVPDTRKQPEITTQESTPVNWETEIGGTDSEFGL